MRRLTIGWCRNALSWDEKFALDLEYIEKRSWRLDLAILAQTVVAVIRRRGIAARADGTTPLFRGSDPARGDSSATPGPALEEQP